MKGLFVGGGQEYHGDTAERDAQVVKLLAGELYAAGFGRGLQVITGGMPGIPEDFAKVWKALGGSVLCIVSSEQEEAFKVRNTSLGFEYQVAGETQEARRIAATRWPNLICALFIQGGKYSTHEMQLLEERQIPIVPFYGSGGAAGGTQPYNGYVYTQFPRLFLSCSKNPKASPIGIASELAVLTTYYISPVGSQGHTMALKLLRDLASMAISLPDSTKMSAGRSYHEQTPEERQKIHNFMFAGISDPNLIASRMQQEAAWMAKSRPKHSNIHVSSSEFPYPERMVPLCVSSQYAVAMEYEKKDYMNSHTSQIMIPDPQTAEKNQLDEFVAYLEEYVPLIPNVHHLSVLRDNMLAAIKLGQPYEQALAPYLPKLADIEKRLSATFLEKAAATMEEAKNMAVAEVIAKGLPEEKRKEIEEEAKKKREKLPAPKAKVSNIVIDPILPEDDSMYPRQSIGIWICMTPIQLPILNSSTYGKMKKKNKERCVWTKKLTIEVAAGTVPVASALHDVLMLCFQTPYGITKVMMIQMVEWKIVHEFLVSPADPTPPPVVIPPEMPSNVDDKPPVAENSMQVLATPLGCHIPKQGKEVMIWYHNCLMFANATPPVEGKKKKGGAGRMLRIGFSNVTVTAATLEHRDIIVGTSLGQIIVLAEFARGQTVHFPMPVRMPIKQVIKEGYDIYAINVAELMQVITVDIEGSLVGNPKLYGEPKLRSGFITPARLPFCITACGGLVSTLTVDGRVTLQSTYSRPGILEVNDDAGKSFPIYLDPSKRKLGLSFGYKAVHMDTHTLNCVLPNGELFAAFCGYKSK